MDSAGLSRMLILLGLLIIGIGLFVRVIGVIPGLGKLPGDILIKKGNFTFYFPLATSVIISFLLTLLFSLLRR